MKSGYKTLQARERPDRGTRGEHGTAPGPQGPYHSIIAQAEEAWKVKGLWSAVLLEMGSRVQSPHLLQALIAK